MPHWTDFEGFHISSALYKPETNLEDKNRKSEARYKQDPIDQLELHCHSPDYQKITYRLGQRSRMRPYVLVSQARTCPCNRREAQGLGLPCGQCDCQQPRVLCRLPKTTERLLRVTDNWLLEITRRKPCDCGAVEEIAGGDLRAVDEQSVGRVTQRSSFGTSEPRADTAIRTGAPKRLRVVNSIGTSPPKSVGNRSPTDRMAVRSRPISGAGTFWGFDRNEIRPADRPLYGRRR